MSSTKFIKKITHNNIDFVIKVESVSIVGGLVISIKDVDLNIYTKAILLNIDAESCDITAGAGAKIPEKMSLTEAIEYCVNNLTSEAKTWAEKMNLSDPITTYFFPNGFDFDREENEERSGN
jgi:hypothetical protein